MVQEGLGSWGASFELFASNLRTGSCDLERDLEVCDLTGLYRLLRNYVCGFYIQQLIFIEVL